MEQLTKHARERESHRSQSALMSGLFTVGMISASIVTLLDGAGPSWLAGLLVILALASLYLSLSMLLPVHPDHLIPLPTPFTGNWSASLPGRSFPEVVQRHPRMKESLVFGGRVNFEPNGEIIWRGQHQYDRYYGPMVRKWAPPYQISARRLKGIGHQVHVVITSNDGESIDDVWILRGKEFPI